MQDAVEGGPFMIICIQISVVITEHQLSDSPDQFWVRWDIVFSKLKLVKSWLTHWSRA